MKTDICILGGGVMGLAAAHNIRKHTDKEILVLDRYGVGNDLCSSNDVNRVFRYSYGNDELYTKMAVESLNLWRELEKESAEHLLTQTGLVLLRGQNQLANAFNEASYRTLSRMGLGAQRMSKEELETRFPQFKADGAWFDPHGGLVLAAKAVKTLHSLTRTRNVAYLKRRALKVVLGEHSRIITESHDEIEFRKLLVTVGPWTNSLRPDRLVPVQPTRQQLIYFHPRAGIAQFRPETFPVFFTDEHYGLPAEGTDAVKVSAKELAEPVDPETAKRSVDPDQIIACRESCRKFVPGLADGEVVRFKVCLYDMTENSDFVIDRDPENPDTIYGYGFSGHGFKFAPLIGKLLAELCLDRDLAFDLDRFSARPNRRKPPVIGATLGKGE